MDICKPLNTIFRLTPKQNEALERLGIETTYDLVRHFPARYEDRAHLKYIADINEGEHVLVDGIIQEISHKKTWKKRMNITEAVLADSTGALRLAWFHQPYVARMLKKGSRVRIMGDVKLSKGHPYVANPVFEKSAESIIEYNQSREGLIPIYPETRGLSSRWFQFHIQKALSVLPKTIDDPIPDNILAEYNLPDLSTSLRKIHAPISLKEVEALKKRFAFEEIFLIQLTRIKERMKINSQKAPAISRDRNTEQTLLDSLRFGLTKAQERTLDEICEDISQKHPMARLLEGDVGSGKTIIATLAALSALRSGFQTAYMAPTEILARQQFKNLSGLLGPLGYKIGFLTSAEARVFPSKAFPNQSAHIPKAQCLKWIAGGDISIVVGTHALANEKIIWKSLAFIIVDEQHRFGIRQRARLARSKSKTHAHIPHFLSMTATPIPRTLALTVYGDLDLSLIDEMPKKRKPIITKTYVKEKNDPWELVRSEIRAGRQAFIVYPRIEQGDDDIKSVKAEYEKISKKILPEYKSAMMHGKMTPKEREKIMAEFVKNNIQMLVATTVIEVGIDIPNATVMVVEGAERYGLAQLHQLRGRVGRGEHQSYFIAITDSSAQNTRKRLEALQTAKNGFELAEYDLMLRGPGELTGKNQWGMTDLGMEALKNIKMVEAARKEARILLEQDIELGSYPNLKKTINLLKPLELHFE